MMMAKLQQKRRFAAGFARIFAPLASSRYRSSPAMSPPFRDGTDPRSGGQERQPGVRQFVGRLRPGGAR